MSLVVTILGCGSSGGVPRVGQGWGACDPANAKNRRRRCAILVERIGAGGTTSVLIDTGPDLREQLIAAGVTRLDGVLFTHDHADHTHGIDDLRPLVLTMRRRIMAYADPVTAETLGARFGYCFVSPPGSDYPPIINLDRFESEVPLTVDGPGGPLTFTPFPVVHGAGYQAFGFRFESCVYCPDVSWLNGSEPYFDQARLVILDALRETRHPTHFSVSEALAVIAAHRPAHAVLTNLHTDLDYAALASRLPDGIEPAFDGMRLVLDD